MLLFLKRTCNCSPKKVQFLFRPKITVASKAARGRSVGGSMAKLEGLGHWMMKLQSQAAQASKFHVMFFKVFQDDGCYEKESCDGGGW